MIHARHTGAEGATPRRVLGLSLPMVVLLAAIAAIRTGLDFVLQREIREEEQRFARRGDPAERATRLAPEPTTNEPARDR